MQLQLATLTNWVSIKEAYGCPQKGCEHSVVQYPGGIYADDVEADSSCKVQNDGECCYPSISQNSFSCEKPAGSSLCAIVVAITISPIP